MNKKTLMIVTRNWSGLDFATETLLEPYFKVIPWEGEGEPDGIVYTGGEDVDPHLYGEEVGPYTSYNRHRDDWEMRITNKYKELPKIGICRGFQFLNVVAGGKLHQHIKRHAGHNHQITTGGGSFTVNSLHHQAINPGKIQYHSLAESPDLIEEAGIFPAINGFGVQFHPEFMNPESAAVKFFIDNVKGLV